MNNYSSNLEIKNDIKIEISNLKEKLFCLNEEEKELISNIKKHIYYFNGIKPGSISQLMTATIHYLLRKQPNYSNNISLTQAEKWDNNGHATNEKLPYYQCWLDSFKDYDGCTSCTNLVELNNFHHAVKVKTIWKYAVQEWAYELSFKEFEKEYQGKKLYEYLTEEKRFESYDAKRPYKNQLFLVNNRHLSIKNIIVVFPKPVKNIYND